MEREGMVRTTAYGQVMGTRTGDSYVWYGVPYGKEPSGELRWQAPEVPETWDDIYDAAHPMEQAMQPGPDGVNGTEDCLKLDIYSTGNAERFPVLVFLHGGNNQNGTTEELKGAELAGKDDVVVVSVGYRLGLLAFNALPAVSDEVYQTGNYALLDIALALDWIKENIEVFGGDPENITVSGFSAGGRSVMAMLISPLFSGKFHKAIVFSGGMTIADMQMGREKAAGYLASLAVRDGKAADVPAAESWLQRSEPDVRDYLYSLAAEELCGLIGGAAIRMEVFPHLFADGNVLPENGFDTEIYNQVALVMVTGTTEFSCFVLGDPYFESEEIKSLSEKELQTARAFAIRYGSAMYRYFNTDASAQKMGSRYQAPIYLCDINYGNMDSPYPIPDMGSFHGIFLPMLWSRAECTANAPEGTFTHPSYLSMAELFHAYLKQFLYTGDPNHAGSPKWCEWNERTRRSLLLDGAGDGVSAICKTNKDSYASILEEMEQDNSVEKSVKEKLMRNVLNGRWFSEALDAHTARFWGRHRILF